MLKFNLKPLTPVAAIAVVLGLLLPGGPVEAKFQPPANLSRPGNREGASTRGGCFATNAPPLTALVPLSNMGLTTTAHPTFYWYLPQHNYPLAHFAVYAPGEPAGEETAIYQTIFKLSGQSGLAQLKLPPEVTLPPLAVNQDYRWELTLLCQASQNFLEDSPGEIIDPSDPSAKLFVQGWIRRVIPDPNLAQQLTQASQLEQYNLYAAAGLWYDALTVLIHLRQTQPQNPALANQWQELLESPSVQLQGIANSPLAQP